MVTITNTDFKSNLSLASTLAVNAKADMLKICKTLDPYISPNLKKDETARNFLSPYYKFYLQLAEAGKKDSSPKEVWMVAFMQCLRDDKE